MNKLINFLRSIFLDECGEDDPGQDGDPGNTGQVTDTQDPPADTGADGADNGQGGNAPGKTPKYGEFGDQADPDKIYEAFTKLKADHDGLSKKTGATESNLSALRKTLADAGIKVIPTEDGSIQLALAEPKTKEQAKKQRRFTDQHKGLFNPQVLEAIEFRAMDLFDEWFDQRQSENDKRAKEQRQWAIDKSQANGRMVQLFPSLLSQKDGKPNPSYNKKFWDKATEIFESRYSNNPKGELFAALEAAAEMNITPTNLEVARREGFQAGREAKKIIGPVTPSGQKPAPGQNRELSKEEYFKLPPAEREKYDKKNIGI